MKIKIGFFIIIFVFIILFTLFQRSSNVAEGTEGYSSLIANVQIYDRMSITGIKCEGIIIRILGFEVYNSIKNK